MSTAQRELFLANNFGLPALTTTEIYRCRWQVEFFFKWDQAASSDENLLRSFGERGQVA